MRVATTPSGMSVPGALSVSRDARVGARAGIRRPADRVRSAHPKIVALGGGTGLPAVLRGLAADGHGTPCPETLTAVVTVMDDGGSSGRLRERFGVLPPGDVRNCLVALARGDSPVAQLLQHRFAPERPADAEHAVGNLLLSALTQVTGDFSRAVDHVGALIGSRGRVLPITLADVQLRAEMDSGEFVLGETAIAGHPARIRHISLLPTAQPHPDVLRALVNADAIVVGPGSLYSSVLPPLIVDGIAPTIYGVNAVRIYVANLMTEPGETDGYTLDDHLRAIREHTGYDLFDYILVNRTPLDHAAIGRYHHQGASPVDASAELRHAGHARLVQMPLSATSEDGMIRHDPDALASAISCLIKTGRRAD